MDAHKQWTTADVTDFVDDTVLTEQGEALMARLANDFTTTLSPFLDDTIGIRCPGWGIPVKHDPDYESISSVEDKDGVIVVNTQQTRKNGAATLIDRYEYGVVVQDGEPRIIDVHMIWSDGARHKVM
jgi:hypothetical protein